MYDTVPLSPFDKDLFFSFFNRMSFGFDLIKFWFDFYSILF